MQLSRRYFNRQLVRAMAGFGLLPGILRAQKSPGLAGSSRPRAIGGAITGDLIGQSAVFWSRCDRPATMVLEFSTRESFQNASRVRGPAALDDIDFAAKLTVQDLPAGQTIFYRLAFEDMTDTSLLSEPVLGSFRTPPLAKRDILFAWSGDTVGQGYGIDLSRGGMKTYETIRRLKPDFFVHSGDTIYADKPLEAELKLDDGTVWKNLVTDAKSGCVVQFVGENERREGIKTPTAGGRELRLRSRPPAQFNSLTNLLDWPGRMSCLSRETGRTRKSEATRKAKVVG